MAANTQPSADPSIRVTADRDDAPPAAHARPEAGQKPSVGRIVHYVSANADDRPHDHLAAIITDVHDDGVALCVFNTVGMAFFQFVAQDETAAQDGTWHWPEFVR